MYAGGIMNQETIMAVLPDHAEKAMSMREIARVIGLKVCTYIDWIKAERSLSRTLRKLIRWGLVARDRRQSTEGHRFWYNVYWKVGPMVSEEAAEAEVTA
jgi:predicted transcriptional regulator